MLLVVNVVLAPMAKVDGPVEGSVQVVPTFPDVREALPLNEIAPTILLAKLSVAPLLKVLVLLSVKPPVVFSVSLPLSKVKVPF
jgi:hypothetical protein